MSHLLLFQKIEIIDDEESDMISNSEVDQMSSLLDYKVSNSDYEMFSRIVLHRTFWQVCLWGIQQRREPGTPLLLPESQSATCHPFSHISSSLLKSVYPYFSAEGSRKSSISTEELCYSGCSHLQLPPRVPRQIYVVSKTKLHRSVPKLFFGVLQRDSKSSMMLPALERDVTAELF